MQLLLYEDGTRHFVELLRSLLYGTTYTHCQDAGHGIMLTPTRSFPPLYRQPDSSFGPVLGVSFASQTHADTAVSSTYTALPRSELDRSCHACSALGRGQSNQTQQSAPMWWSQKMVARRGRSNDAAIAGRYNTATPSPTINIWKQGYGLNFRPTYTVYTRINLQENWCYYHTVTSTATCQSDLQL